MVNEVHMPHRDLPIRTILYRITRRFVQNRTLSRQVGRRVGGQDIDLGIPPLQRPLSDLIFSKGVISTCLCS
jgi:hypothetical protein